MEENMKGRCATCRHWGERPTEGIDASRTHAICSLATNTNVYDHLFYEASEFADAAGLIDLEHEDDCPCPGCRARNEVFDPELDRLSLGYPLIIVSDAAFNFFTGRIDAELTTSFDFGCVRWEAKE